jgi:membrane fusion protein, multidrug efflux system
MKNNIFTGLFLAVLVAVAGGTWIFFERDSSQSGGPGFGGAAALVSLEPVRLEIVADRVEAVGTLIANESITISSKVSDIVTAVHFEDGDFVEAGYILVELLNQEQSALLAEAQANLIDTGLQLERLETLGSNVASASQIDEARARNDANQAKLNATISRMEDRLIRAPFSGVLGFRDVSLGTLVSANTPITTLDDISVLELDFSIPETAFGAVGIGDLVEANSAAYSNLSFAAVVSSIGSRIDPVTRTAQIRAKLSNEERKLRPGMFMTLSLVADERESIVIPEAALLQKGERSMVYVVNEEMKVSERDVVIEKRLRGEVVIAEGLEPDEMLVVDGIMAVRNGSSVRVAGATPAGPGAGAQLPGGAGGQ